VCPFFVVLLSVPFCLRSKSRRLLVLQGVRRYRKRAYPVFPILAQIAQLIYPSVFWGSPGPTDQVLAMQFANLGRTQLRKFRSQLIARASPP